MSLTGAQHGLHNRLFADVLKVYPETDRKEMYEELGLPASRKEWNNGHFDEFKRACLAITDPANLDAQIAGLSGKVARRLWVIRDVLGKLCRPLSYAETTAQNMGLPLPLETLDADDLERVIVALKKQLQRDRRRGDDGEAEKPF